MKSSPSVDILATGGKKLANFNSITSGGGAGAGAGAGAGTGLAQAITIEVNKATTSNKQPTINPTFLLILSPPFYLLILAVYTLSSFLFLLTSSLRIGSFWHSKVSRFSAYTKL